jgi:peptide/nickel transport system substrate-binding protein
VLRVVPHSNLAVLDPIWTTAYMSRNHGYMIYDTLFGTDEKAQITPRWWRAGPSARTTGCTTFKLRKGLEFHDGKPVTERGRGGQPAALGQARCHGLSALCTFVSRMDTPAPDTFRIFLGEACGFVLEALGKPSSSVPFIMPKRIADTDPFKQIEEHIGSGPYVFVKEEFKPGDKAVYTKFAKYVPRNEPPSGTAGGKRVFVDRVEWNLALRDAQAQVDALKKGEVDIIEALPLRLLRDREGRCDSCRCPSTPRWACSTWRASTTCTSPSTTPRCARPPSPPSARSRSCAAQVGVKELLPHLPRRCSSATRPTAAWPAATCRARAA